MDEPQNRSDVPCVPGSDQNRIGLAAIQRCPHCPFLVKFSDQAEGILRDATFTEEDVDKWINSKPWPCHKHLDRTPCVGQKLFQQGKIDVTRKELIDIWVNEKIPSEL